MDGKTSQGRCQPSHLPRNSSDQVVFWERGSEVSIKRGIKAVNALKNNEPRVLNCKCFKCQQEGHIVKYCKQKIENRTVYSCG
ncbi:hypothetical protein PR048_006041 [Dryococelus australis]|uniref:CCHC-type domain-containing protein n=1 Tax=Dryococelus australis TaxID=614101 RepID=A0ABQ9I9V7_9NEOP|nr:hypothetical protein PR048_006041 [Dryococelus australis]